MRGLLSPCPGQSAIRILVGTHLLLLLQAALVLWSAPRVDPMLTVIVALTAILGIGGFIAALHGGTIEDGSIWSPRRRHVRATWKAGQP